MFLTAMTVSPIFAFQQSDLVGRIIVVFLLLVSIISWTIMIEKWSSLKKIIKQSKNQLMLFEQSTGFSDTLLVFQDWKGPLKRISENGIKSIANIKGITCQDLISELSDDPSAISLNESDHELLYLSLKNSVDEELTKLESNFSLLGSIVSSSPYIGLLGTVWGVMMAFCGMAIKGKADISAIAPGVSGALLTTVAALFVAIPALIGYNHLNYSIKLLTMDFDYYVDRFSKLLKTYSPTNRMN